MLRLGTSPGSLITLFSTNQGDYMELRYGLSSHAWFLLSGRGDLPTRLRFEA